jgi:hypothetical protein
MPKVIQEALDALTHVPWQPAAISVNSGPEPDPVAGWGFIPLLHPQSSLTSSQDVHPAL